MSRFTSYYLYQKYEKVGDGEWTPTYPNEYSISGDTENTMPLVIKSENDENCGYRDPIYRWADTEDTMCVGYDKYAVQKRQVSYDNGLTWEDVTPSETRAGSLIEAYSEDCGYVPTTIYRWVDTQDTICVYEDEHDYSKDYLTFEIISDGGITWTARDCLSYTGKTISYSRDDGNTWTNITSSTSGTRFHVSAGDKILFKGNNSTYGDDEEPFNACSYSSFSGSTAQFNVYGNIMSLISGDSFENATTLDRGNTFLKLFEDTNVISAENLVLPATTLTENCYRSMFYRCTSLTVAPELPATTLASGCYEGMFETCESLTTAPALPATTLADYCYDSMFRVCFSLTSVPSTLSATTLADHCYAFMFENCSSLTTAPALPATTLTEGCYNRMFGNCSSLTTAPVLSATTLADHCYQQMFESCTSLNYIKCLATDISATDCTSNWTRWTSSNGTFVKNASMNNWSTGSNGIPSGWTIQNA